MCWTRRRALHVLLEIASSDTRLGAVNDGLDLAHFTRPLGVRFTLCGSLDDRLIEMAQVSGIGTVRRASHSMSKRGILRYVADVAGWLGRLQRLRPDIVHLNYVGWGPSLACAARLCRIPVVGRAGGQFQSRNLSNRWIAAYVANCEAQAASLLASPLASRVVVTGDLFRPERLERCPRLERPIPARRGKVPRFLFLGQLVERKGLAVLVEAVTGMTADADLLLVGGDWEAEGHPQQIRRLITDSGLGGRVHCENHRTDVAALLAESDGLVLASLAEARPRCILEAMFAGRAVIASAVGGIPEMVQHGVTGLLVPPGDAKALAAALDQLAGSDALRGALGEAAQRHARSEFRPEVTAARYVHLYRQLALRDSGVVPPAVHRLDARTPSERL